MENNQIFLLGELFEQVQLQKIFSDGKTFVDCIPTNDLKEIQQAYEKDKIEPGFDLATFVHENFKLPPEAPTDYESDKSVSISKHITELWDVLLRSPENHQSGSSLINLPHPYIVPGGRFREIYYWDSYFTMLGLVASRKIDLVESMIKNFSWLIDTYGYIPNGNRTYFLGRSQPPFFSCMVRLLAEVKGKQIFSEYLPSMLKEYNFWMRGSEILHDGKTSVKRVVLLQNGNILNRYWDENDSPRPESYTEDIALASHVTDRKKLFRNLRAACESGWDFSSRWFSDFNNFSSINTTDILPVDLNCLLYHLEKTIGEAGELTGDIPTAEKFLALSNLRKDTIDQYCWSKIKQFYFDYDHVAGRQTDAETLASAYPLFFKIASNEKANAVAKRLQQDFLNSGGFVTTTETTRQQWDAPNGWAPLQWIAIKGLMNYAHDSIAENAVSAWMKINEEVFQKTGKMMEKYNVADTGVTAGGGEYPSQDGFGWTNGVYLKLHELFGEK